ncbi:hypothetical protein EVAR_71805_1 [Eumeta japonica]|uniref:Uncharacterized protein n=1 Tax=Eumeta variegata TaxID=151549 RepID=A0A4C1SGH4_EUMVA|nr:hypothetical protein EVAR_71805_1 [Eumeta japonica]
MRAELETAKIRLAKKDQQLQKLEKDLKMKQEKLEQNKDTTKNSPVGAAEPNNTPLQQKVKELQERLDGNKKTSLTMKICFHYAETSLRSNVSLGSNERPCVRKTELQHRAKVENLEKQIANLKSELDDNRSKILALKVRNKTLNDEISRYKVKANTLEEQTDFNNFNVATMNDRLNHQKSYYEKLLNEFSKDKEQLIKEKQEIKNSLLELNKTLDERLTQERIKTDNLCEQAAKQKYEFLALKAVRDLERELELQTEKRNELNVLQSTPAVYPLQEALLLGSFIFENSSITAVVNNKAEQSDEDLNDLKNRYELLLKVIFKSR